MRPPPDSGPPHLDPPWEPLEGGGVGAAMPRWAGEAVRGRALVPGFSLGDEGSGWNDFTAAHGRDAVRGRVMEAVREAGSEWWQDRPQRQLARTR